jgi:hypothetical protein
MLIKDILRELELGSSVAEHDDALEDYFIETETFRALVADQHDTIAGDKGTGKMALYRILQKRYTTLLEDVEVLAGSNPVGWSVFERLAEGESHSEGQYVTVGARRVDAELGDVLAGRRPGRASDDDVVLVNPFGMGVADVALMAAVHAEAVRRGMGTWLVP